MKTLLLLRHAKSDRSASVSDADRPLNERGRNTAPRMGAEMAGRGFLPDLALVSTAERTRQTWDLIRAELGKRAAVEFRPELYLAAASRLLEIIRRTDRNFSVLLVVGHNPGLEDLAVRLAAEDQAADGVRSLAKIKSKYPTCALAVLTFAIDDWSELHPGSGVLTAFLAPNSLKD